MTDGGHIEKPAYTLSRSVSKSLLEGDSAYAVSGSKAYSRAYEVDGALWSMCVRVLLAGVAFYNKTRIKQKSQLFFISFFFLVIFFILF